jgi:hypothetical protein
MMRRRCAAPEGQQSCLFVRALALLAFLGALVAGCAPAGGTTPEWPTVQYDGTLILVAGGYGYELADVVRVDIGRSPQPGDIVQYDDRLNGTDCGAFGPGQYLARVAGLPGATVSFEECAFVAGCFIGAIECGPDISPRTQGVYWGEDWHEDINGMSLVVPGGEYLVNRWVGQECRQVGSDFRAGSRFTVRDEAIVGVVMKKVGHDDRMQQYLEGIRY